MANSKKNETYALAKFKIIDLASNGDKNPVKTFVNKHRKNKYFKEVIINTKKVIKLRKQSHIKVVRKFGKACSYPGTFMGSIHFAAIKPESIPSDWVRRTLSAKNILKYIYS